MDVNKPWPCLMILHGTVKNPTLTFYNVSDENYQSKTPKECRNKDMLWSYGEWVMLRDTINSADFCLLNVLTMEILQLPSLDGSLSIRQVGPILSSPHPTTDTNCRVFLQIDTMKGLCLSCQMGAEQFHLQNFNLDNMLMDAIILQGKMYGFTLTDRNLICSDIKEGDPSSIQFRECINGAQELTDDKSLFWNNGRKILSHGIVRQDLDGAIFLDEWRSFCSCISGCGLKGNCIYFTGLDATLHVYDLEDHGVIMPPPFRFTMKDPKLCWLLISNTSSPY
ncbi:OLC1v1002578C1 [Oldenlandia corymbosa var. corymbosa]|uniref:OLC1v1002578C1 n=1 Tax=Oldenlandia corymbosa var. corymbosa TaxID=529605 RepID=A0AAV1DAU0_OLDCO|nr:OLC1v1002578C1 [Oldenlandia corymbosa var. corymbosa]